MKEKIQITERSGFPYLIIDRENSEEVAKVQKELHAYAEIYDVSTVGQAL